jgi:glycine oxidase
MNGATGADVVIVGGGVIGASIAWKAAAAGLRVVLVDDQRRARASWAAAGMLAPVAEVSYNEEPLLALSLRSAERYPSFVAELQEATGLTVGYRRCGSLLVAVDGDDHASLVALHEFQRRLGLTAERLTSRETRAMEPSLAPGVRSGVWVEGDHQIDNRRLLDALQGAVWAAGAIVESGVGRVVVDDGRVTGVTVDDGRVIATRTIVVSSGCWSAEVGGLPDSVRPPIRPVKGQILRLAMPVGEPILSRIVRARVHGQAVYLVPRASGELVVGGTVEERGYDDIVTAGAVHDLLRDARTVVPDVAECQLVEHWAGLRPATPDNAPILSDTATTGLILAAGHFRNGVLLTPATADIIVERLITGQFPSYAAPFTADRFASQSFGGQR